MRHFAQLSLAVLLAASQLGPAASTAHAQQADNRVSLNFVDTDIPAVLRALSLFTQRNFLVDPRVKGKLTLVSDRPVDSGQALAMLTGALRLQGFAIVDVDGVTRVVPEADAKLQGSAVVGDPRPAPAGATGAGRPPAPVPVAAFAKGRGGSSGEMLTRVFPLKYENAANLVPVLRPMVPPNNPINAYPGNNTLVVTDYADNLERIASVIARIDVPSSIDTDVVPVRSGIASDIAVLASQLLDTQSSDPTQRIAVVADPRSNSVLVRAGSPARTRLARDLIMKLDAQQTRAGNLHVVYMRNAQATRIAEVLGGLLAAFILLQIAQGQAGFAIDGSQAGAFASNGYGALSPGGYGVAAAFLCEVVMTAMFLVVIMGATHGKAPAGFAPIAIGLALTLIHLISIPVTNTSVNPARSTAVAVFAGPGAIGQLWLFWVAPLLGALIGGLAYKWVGSDTR